MGDNPLVSIIVPVYNTEKYLVRCLDSIVNQTYRNIEIICVNDGSPDGSRGILERYAAQDPRVVIINQENQGLSGARNTGLKAVRGKYVTFVDSDDRIELDTCALAVNAAETNGADLVFWSYVRDFDDHSREKHFFWEDGTVFSEDEVKNQLQRRLCGLLGEELAHPDYANAFETVWNKLYRSDRILQNGVLFVDTKEIGTEDALFNLYALHYIKKATYIKKCLYHYTKTNDSSVTVTYKERLFSQWQNLFAKMETFVQENNLPKSFSDALDNRVALSLVGLGLNVVSGNFKAGKKIKLIKEIISTEKYVKAYKKLNYKFFPLHWKVFFLSAKYKSAVAVYFLLVCIKKLIYK